MSKHAFGLALVEISDLAADGDIGTAWQPVGETVADSASLTSTTPSNTDFKIEESDAPVESVVSTPAITSFAWSTYNIDYDSLILLFGGTKILAAALGGINTFGAITGGSAYTNGTYLNVPLTGGAGTGAYADITIAGGAVTAVNIRAKGASYVVGNSLSAAAANIGGTGTGFAVAVATVQTSTTVQGRWDAPDSLPVLEKSLRLTDKKGNQVLVPRASISTKLSMSFSKTKLGQLDMVATILAPTKTGVKKYSILYAF
jgi:hypothetical protein